MKTSTKSSLIISTYNWPEALRLCLLSVIAQSVLPDEVIIADDGSTQQTIEIIDAMRPVFPVRLVHIWHKDEGFQLSKIRNKAIATSAYDYIIQIDGDLILHKHFIKDHLNLSKPGSFITGSRVLMSQQLSERLLRLQKTNIQIFEPGLGNLFNRVNASWLSRYLADRYKTRDIFSLRGCNMAFWKADLVRVNGYNECFIGWGREDNEIAVRLLNSGLRKRTIKFGGIVFHIHHREADRKGCQENEGYLTYALQNKSVYCSQGLNQYFTAYSEIEQAESEFSI
ncbi:glycosyltransferase family 2 protein [Dyadobacter sp. CY356]|uniref:glycosyltransferase family 2 protein n=1 Tax=Dyadobacter sp. CY356 TaxID=2906442 RepID=UPI001F310837|nr:glycosyltransferase family 2 protein [Dyadobacter sp. CY356]MCF0055938.1 glycosyltransferase family 2 protein [Dyadobacter sp. CY356]